MTMLLSVEHIDAYYGHIHALDDISFTVNKGEVVTLLGANGAGKTTTLRTITGLLNPNRGQIEFQGRKIHHLQTESIVRMGISLVPEGRRLFPELTVFENLEMGSFFRKDKLKVKEDLKKVFEYFPLLEERKKQVASTLSGGEQQMLAISRGLMSNPQLLLLDEPSLGLAPLIVEEIFQIIERISNEGTTLLLVEQNAIMALSVSSYGHIIENGKIVMSDSCENLVGNEKVKASYLGMDESGIEGGDEEGMQRGNG
jgi:branched-chain amino acid transport system ATP-binding protein